MQALVGADNRSLTSMATDQLFELLTLDSSADASASDERVNVKPAPRPSASTDEVSDEQKWNLEQLWDESQYDDAFDVSAFLAQIDSSNQRT